jgi:hypothetical protein
MRSNVKAVLGLAALVFCFSLCVAFLAPDYGTLSRVLASGGLLLFGITVTYAYPVSGVTAPTAGQTLRKNLVTAVVIIGDTDTTTVVTHNWGLLASELADRFPIIVWNYVTPGTAPLLLSFSRATNAVTVNKPSAVGSGATFEISLLRPHTIIR